MFRHTHKVHVGIRLSECKRELQHRCKGTLGPIKDLNYIKGVLLLTQNMDPYVLFGGYFLGARNATEDLDNDVNVRKCER
jgi:hypothetical protein